MKTRAKAVGRGETPGPFRLLGGLMTTEVRDYCRAAAARNRDRQLERRRMKAEEARKRYHALRAHGLCVRCKADSPTHSLCDSCRLWFNQHRSGARSAPRTPYKDGRRT